MTECQISSSGAGLRQVSLGFRERLLLGLFARRALGAREARAGVDVVDRAVKTSPS